MCVYIAYVIKLGLTFNEVVTPYTEQDCFEELFETVNITRW